MSKIVPTLCKCPKCGALHKKRLNWRGRGIPRKYCNRCRSGGKAESKGVKTYKSIMEA